MKLLVAFATSQGSTEGIAARIADRLRSMGTEVDLKALPDLSDAQGYDAAIVGSAVHGGRWLPEASLAPHASELRGCPVWLFSVSSVGDTTSFFPRPVSHVMRGAAGEPKDIAAFRKSFDVRGHRNFAGVIRKGDWSRSGDLFLRALGGRFGDRRDWHDIDNWTDGIAAEVADFTESTRDANV